MAHDDDDRNDHSAERDNKGSPVGAVQVATTDPVVNAEDDQANEWRRQPDATIYTETTTVREPLPVHRTRVRTTVVDEPAPDRRAPAERDRRESEDREEAPPRSAGLGMGSYLLIGAIALLCGILGAWGYSSFSGDSSNKGDQKSSSKTSDSGDKSGGSKTKKSDDEEAGSKAESATEIPGFTSASDADTLKKQISHLAERIDQLGQRIDSLDRPRNETPPDVHTLQNKVGELAREVDEVADLPSKYRRLENRLEELRAAVKTLRDHGPSTDDNHEEIQAVDQAVKTLSDGKVPSTSPPPRTDGRKSSDDAAMTEALDLFHLAKYAMAREILHKMQVTRPDDARVWYFSALARGLTTGDWQGETRTLLTRGIERERAGTPPTPVIDQSLSDLEPSQKRWLASYRGRLARRE